MSNEIARRNEADNALASLSGTRDTFATSFDTSTDEGKYALFAAQSEALPLVDHLGKTINLVHYVGQIVQITDDEDDNATSEALSIILIDADGTSYRATSKGIYSSLNNIVQIFGEPGAWNSPKPVQAVEERGRNGFRFMTLKMVAPGTAK